MDQRYNFFRIIKIFSLFFFTLILEDTCLSQDSRYQSKISTETYLDKFSRKPKKYMTWTGKERVPYQASDNKISFPFFKTKKIREEDNSSQTEIIQEEFIEEKKNKVALEKPSI